MRAGHEITFNNDRTAIVASYVPDALKTALGRRHAAPGWAETLDGTLVMLDVSGFTPLTEQLARAGKEGAEWLSDVLRDLLAPLLEICRTSGGDVVGFGGDAMLVLFSGEGNRARALVSTLELLRCLETSPRIRCGNRHIRIRMAAGAHSGRFWLLPIGDASSGMDYLLLGPDAEQTARAQNAAASGELVATLDVVSGLDALVESEPLGDMRRVRRVVEVDRCPPERTAAAATLLPPASAERLAPFAPPQVRDAILDGQDWMASCEDHREVCVVFVGLTRIGRLISVEGAEAICRRLTVELGRVMDAIRECCGYLVSTDVSPDGVKLLVVFGAPFAHEHDTANAMRFALQVQAQAVSWAEPPPQVGIAAGHVFAGEVGNAWRRQYTVLGDTVNVAARLMAAAEPGQILVASAAVQAAGTSFAAHEVAPLSLKGKNDLQPVSVLVAEAATGASERTRWAVPLVGRAEEMRVVRSALAEAKRGAVRALVVKGAPGVGKSRLAEEAIRYAQAGGWRVHAGSCFEHTMGSPFSAWRQLLCSVLGITEHEGAEDRAAHAAEQVETLCPQRVESAPLLDPVLGIDLDATAFTAALEPGAARSTLLRLMVELVEATARQGPQLLFIDDIQWADPSSRELVMRLGAAATSVPVLLLLTERTNGRDLTLPDARTVVLSLDELGAQSARELTEYLMSNEGLSPDVEQVLSTTAGNPLFITQVVESIVDGGPLAAWQGRGSAMAPDGVPPHVQGLIASRIDSLERTERDVVRAAAVFGEEFTIDALAEILASNDAQPSPAILDRLVQAGFLRSSRNGQTAYRFSHGLVRQAAYEGMRFTRRRELQERAGVRLERLNAGQLDSAYEALAYHFSQSARRDAARRYAILAAEKAAASYAFQEAIGFYWLALRATKARTPDAARWRGTVLERIGDAYYAMVLDERSARTYTAALRTWERASGVVPGAVGEMDLPAVSSEWTRAAEEAVLRMKTGEAWNDPRRKVTWLRSAYDLAPRGELKLRARISQQLGFALSETGDADEAVRWGRQGAGLARRTHDGPALFSAHLSLATTYMGAVGRYREGVGSLAAATAVYCESKGLSIPRPSHTADARDRLIQVMQSPMLSEGALWAGGATEQQSAEICVGFLGDAMGEYVLAEHATLEALALMTRYGAEPNAVDTYLANLGAPEFMQGKYDDARRHLHRAIDAAERVGGEFGTLASCFLDLCRMALTQGDVGEASGCLLEARGHIRACGLFEFVLAGRLLDARIHLQEGDNKAALTLARGVLRRAQARGVRLHQPEALRVMGLASWANGDAAQAESLLIESVRRAGRMPMYYDQALSTLELARVGYASGAHRARWAARLLERAEESLCRSGALPDANRAAEIRASMAAVSR